MHTLLSLFTIAVAHAQLELPSAVPAGTQGSYALAFICTILFKWIFTAAIIASIILTLVAAFRYLTSAGDPAKVTKAHNTLIYVAIGVAVAIFARSLPVIVGSFLRDGANFDPCPAGPAPATTTTTTGT